MAIAYLYGAGGHAKVISEILSENAIDIPAIYDNDTSITQFLNIPVKHLNFQSPIIITIGNNSVRKKISEELNSIEFGVALSKQAVISSSATILDGTVVMQGVVIQASVQVGKHVIINTGSTIDHDCVIHDFAHIAPGVNLCGNVEVGEGSLIGVGSAVIPGIKIGKWCTIGAGSVVTKNIPDNSLAAGNPARIIKTKTL